MSWYLVSSPYELTHHGIKGQRWGIRRTQSELGYDNSENSDILSRKVHFRSNNMSMEEYARACDLWRQYSELNLSYREKAHVYEELDNNLSDDEKECCLVSDDIGNYHYTAINKGHNQYKIIDKYVNEQDGSLDAVMTEVIGPDWRDYDE